jgi:nitrite reductase/ring-hydroxylating ferredoxin subunit
LTLAADGRYIKRGSAADPDRLSWQEENLQEIFVSELDEIPDKGRKLIKYNEKEIGIFRLEGEVFAWENRCAHQGGPVCQGRLFPKVLQTLGENQTTENMRYSDDELHIVCPWHGYEYNVRTGRNSGHPNLRLRQVETVVRDGSVYVLL